VAPDIVLLDPRMRAYFAAPAHGGHEAQADFYRWLHRHEGQLTGRVEDSTYGLMEIYQVKR
jgi:hypothetical protein